MFKTKTILKIAIIFLGLIFLLGFFVWPNFSKPTRASNWGGVVINEIMWMGSSLSSADEWLELRNLTNEDIDFSKTNWHIDKNNSLTVTINQGILYANDYFLIARKSKDQSILNIDSDLIASSSFRLNDSNVQYKLYDEQNILIDIADDGMGNPLAGSKSPEASMERNLNPGDGTLEENWHTATTSVNFDAGVMDLGTPSAENSRENQAPKIILISVSPTSVVADGQSAVKFQTQIQDPDGKQDIKQVTIDLSKIGGEKDKKMSDLGNDLYDYQFVIPKSVKAKKYEILVTVSDNADNTAKSSIFLTVVSPPTNHNPKAMAGDNKKVYVDESVTFDGSDSYDPDNDALAYTWDFGDNSSASGAAVTHTYKKIGKYTAKLKVEDGRGGMDEDTVLVTVSEKKKVVTKKTTKKETKKSTKKSTKKETTKRPKGPFSRRIVVTEIMPNPTGSDTGESGKDKTGEWIEIKNNEKHEVNLSYWQIDDEENNDTPTTLQDVKIKPGQYSVFYYAALKVNLNNNKDEVRILDPDGKIAHKVSYSGSKEGISYAIDEKTKKWYWTQKPTPGKANVIDLVVKKSIKKIDNEDTNYDEIDNTNDSDTNTDDTEETTDIETVDLSDVSEMNNGEKVKVKGWISSAPGIFGKDIFYMQDSTGGMQIYFSKADFPKLTTGDLVSVMGKVSSLAGEKKINVNKKTDITFLSHSSAPKPKKLEIGEIDKSYMGQLISTTGTIAKKIGQNLYLENAGEQIRAYLEKGISLSAEISKGKEIMVAGVLSQTKAGLRILPRSKSDVALAKASTKDTGADAEKAIAKSTDESTNSAQVGNSLKIIILFSVLAAGLATALLFIKKRKTA